MFPERGVGPLHTVQVPAGQDAADSEHQRFGGLLHLLVELRLVSEISFVVAREHRPRGLGVIRQLLQLTSNWQGVSLWELVRFSGELTAFHGDGR